MTTEDLKSLITGGVCWAMHDFISGDVYVMRATGFEFIAVSNDGRIALRYGAQHFPLHLFTISDLLNHMTIYMNKIEENVPLRNETTLVLESDLKTTNKLDDVE